jgi:hypothetical protein
MLQTSLILFFAVGTPEIQETIKTYLSFSIDNKEVVWSQIYHEEKLTSAELSAQVLSHLKRKVWVKNITQEGQDIVADVDRLKFEYKRYGGKFMNTSTVLRTGRWYGKLRISFKEGKYRVIVYGLHYMALQPESGSGKATIPGHETSGTFSEWVLNDYHSAFRKSRFSNLDIIHHNLKDSFTLEEGQLIDSDW